jgi:hypothetical protein
VSDVLAMTAFEHCSPVVLVVFVEPDDSLLHR